MQQQQISWCDQKLTNKCICGFNKYFGAEITLACIVVGALIIFRKQIRSATKVIKDIFKEG